MVARRLTTANKSKVVRVPWHTGMTLTSEQPLRLVENQLFVDTDYTDTVASVAYYGGQLSNLVDQLATGESRDAMADSVKVS